VGKRITGSSVSKGDLVRRKVTQLQLLFHYEKRDMNAERMYKNDEVGIVISTIRPYDRSIGESDCYVFWSRTQSIVKEDSHMLHVLSTAQGKNT